MSTQMHYETVNHLTSALQQYAMKMTSNEGHSNVGSSPLGVWMLMASLLTAHSDVQDSQCKQLLHMDKQTAVSALQALLEDVPVNYAAQGWYAQKNASSKVQSWVNDQKHIIPLTYHLPAQEELDTWADTHTDGIIKKFPLDVDPNMMIIVANAIYSKLSWEKEFEVIPADSDMKTAWNVDTILTREGSIHSLAIIQTNAGDVYAKVRVETTTPGESVDVYLPSIKNENTSNVHITQAMYETEYQFLPLSLELFKQHQFGTVSPASGGVSNVTLTLPAWEVSSTIDLMESLTEVSELVDFLWVEPGVPFDVDAKQVMKASFHKEGFEAAAVTAIMFTRASLSFDSKPLMYNIIFNRPFGFVSSVNNVKVFSGVIHQGEEA